MKAKKTWILVADAAHARFMENLGPGRGLAELTYREIENLIPPTRDLGTDRPGRNHESVGGARHGMAPKADWHDQVKEAFAKDLADRLNAEYSNKTFDRLVLVAPPKTLGHIRSALNPKTTEIVEAELNKDLTGATIDEIAAHVSKVFAV